MALKARSVKRPQSATTTTPIQQMCAAALLYHAATTALLSPDINGLPDDVSWEQVQHYLGPSYPSRFAMPLSLCRVILEISRLARRTPLSDQDEPIAIWLREQLDPWLPLPSASEAFSGEHDRADEIATAATLYALAADILLLKVTQPRLEAEDSRVQGRVKQILNVLQAEVQGLFWNQHYSWPFAIVGCAVQREREMLFLLGRLEKLWERSHWGDVKRTSELLRRMLRSRRQTVQSAFPRAVRSPNSNHYFDQLLHLDGFINLRIDP